MLERLWQRLLAGPIEAAVARALVEHERIRPGPHPEDWLYTHVVHGDRARLHVHSTAVVNNALFNVSSGDITVGEYAFFGHNVSVLTGTHDVTRFGAERQATIPKTGRDVVIGDGVWLASHAIVLGPCVIGEHAVVAAGSVVIDDVAPYTIVVGHPAKPLRTIDHEGPTTGQ